jgi:protein-tyrosine-phosphatase
VTTIPEVHFVCVHNAGRSQMAAALLDHYAAGTVTVRSAGSAPAKEINRAVVKAMIQQAKLTSSNRKAIHATCALHRGPARFTNVVVSKRNRMIELDPHVTGSCALTLTEDEAIALRDVLTHWLG